jgi:hypothetical protein
MDRLKSRASAVCLLAIVFLPWQVCAQEKKTQAYPHRLTGEELKTHFQGTWTVNGATSKATPITFFNSSDGTFRIKSHNTATVPDGFGKREVTEKNQVCLNVQTTSWRGIAGCYRLVETEPKAFSLVRGSYRIDYRR